MKRRELLDHITSLGRAIYGDGEARQIALMVLEEMCGVSRTDLLIAPNEEASLKDEERLFREIAAGRPIQYIIGEADFCGFRIAVREGVLIPRPESEELIRWIVEESQDGARMLDIGTGSGALAIALRRGVAESDITAIEISNEALQIAAENIERLAPEVKLKRGDALDGVEHYVDGEFDVIVSNPPYIPQSEEVNMRINVTKYEPHLALFVPDNDPLIFYRAIARSAAKLLRGGGKLYFEIHETLHREMVEMLKMEGYSEVRLRLDINDKARMICAQRG